MGKYQLNNLSTKHEIKFLKFTDTFIGTNYFNKKNFKKQITLSTFNQLNSSFILLDNNKIIGIRITYAPGKWANEIPTQFIQNTNINLNKVAYFKSLFIDSKYQKQGLGPFLSQKSIAVIKKMGGTHILSHSWKESPNNSSVRYLEKNGFKNLGEIKNFWKNIDYMCTGCNINPCTCTSVEMLLEI